MALLASWVTAPHLKKPLDPEKLVKDLEPKENKKTTPEQSAAVLYEMMGEAGIKGKLMGV